MKQATRTWLWILGAGMSGCLLMAGCGAQEVEVKTRSADVVFVDFLDTVDDVVKRSGTSWPEWDRSDTAGYVSEVCGVRAREDGRLYQRQIEGGPVKDPESAVEEMRAYWESLGYEIGNIFDNMGGNTTGIQINATSPSGIRVQFTPSKETSYINVESDCTLDPAAGKKTS
jgi:hypothetical protein